MFNKKLPLKRKILSLCAGFGYCMPVLILVLCAAGTLSFITHRPAPLDIPKFTFEMIRNVLLTSGIIFASVVALAKEKKMKYCFKTLIGSFSIGLITTYYVNKGIIKSIFGKPMKWYLLNKDVKYSEN